MVLMPHDVKDCLGHGFLLSGLTPSVDGRPSVSRRWATEVFPRSWKLSSVSSEISRTSPTVLRPAAANTCECAPAIQRCRAACRPAIPASDPAYSLRSLPFAFISSERSIELYFREPEAANLCFERNSQFVALLLALCVPKIRFCDIDGDGRPGPV